MYLSLLHCGDVLITEAASLFFQMTSKRRLQTSLALSSDDAPEFASSSPSKPDLFTRYYYQEVMAANWLVLALTVMFLGVSVHINLHSVMGVIVLLLGISLLLLELVGTVLWMTRGESDTNWLLELRRGLLVAKLALLVGVVGVAVWAAVVMIQRVA